MDLFSVFSEHGDIQEKDRVKLATIFFVPEVFFCDFFFFLPLFRAPEQLAQRKIETHCGMPGVRGVNVHAHAEEGLHIH